MIAEQWKFLKQIADEEDAQAQFKACEVFYELSKRTCDPDSFAAGFYRGMSWQLFKSQMEKNPDDCELIEFLEQLNERKLYTGRCILRMSITERGWRLHESSEDEAVRTVREAIRDFMKLSDKFSVGEEEDGN